MLQSKPSHLINDPLQSNRKPRGDRQIRVATTTRTRSHLQEDTTPQEADRAAHTHERARSRTLPRSRKPRLPRSRTTSQTAPQTPLSTPPSPPLLLVAGPPDPRVPPRSPDSRLPAPRPPFLSYHRPHRLQPLPVRSCYRRRLGNPPPPGGRRERRRRPLLHPRPAAECPPLPPLSAPPG